MDYLPYIGIVIALCMSFMVFFQTMTLASRKELVDLEHSFSSLKATVKQMDQRQKRFRAKKKHSLLATLEDHISDMEEDFAYQDAGMQSFERLRYLLQECLQEGKKGPFLKKSL